MRAPVPGFRSNVCVDCQNGVTDSNNITQAKRLPLFTDAPAVDENAAAAPRIYDEVLSVSPKQSRVVSTYRWI
jgi:hypothetical protein